jgi:hypothetical protein
MAIWALNATKNVKAIKTTKISNASISGKIIVFINFFALYSFSPYLRRLMICPVWVSSNGQ